MTTQDTSEIRPSSTAVRTARDVVLLISRVGLGVLMLAHAKLEYDFGGGSLAGVGRSSSSLGFRCPRSAGRPTSFWSQSAASP